MAEDRDGVILVGHSIGGTILLPVFLYHGSDDDTVPFAHLALYAKELPHASVRVLPGRNHQLDDDMSEVAADIRSLE